MQDDVLVSNGLVGLGRAHLRQGEFAVAGRELREALDLAVTFGSRETIPRALDALAAVAERSGDTDRAAMLFGAAEGYAERWELMSGASTRKAMPRRPRDYGPASVSSRTAG
jgi:hypothetical protein